MAVEVYEGLHRGLFDTSDMAAASLSSVFQLWSEVVCNGTDEVDGETAGPLIGEHVEAEESFEFIAYETVDFGNVDVTRQERSERGKIGVGAPAAVDALDYILQA